MAAKRRLGKTDLEVSALGLGTWQFSSGKGVGGTFWAALSDETTAQVVKASLDGGISWFDTAEIYGNGASERALAKALGTCGVAPGSVTIATKWMPAFRFASSILSTIDERLACLSPYPIDLHQVHLPVSFSRIEAEMDAMASLVAEKKIRAVGVSNFSAWQLQRAHAALAKHGLPLASNQVKYSLLDRKVETNGVLASAKALGVSLIAYSPLEQGLLTGRFHDDHDAVKAVSGPRRLKTGFGASKLERTRPVIDVLKQVAAAHGATPAQVALAWLVQFHGDAVVAIPGASSERQAKSNAAAMELLLTKAELDALDQVTQRYR
jgi:aryl-alcohol dehydrogenase-like predicted oxidoreductase